MRPVVSLRRRPRDSKPTSPLQTVRAAAHGGQDLRLLVDEGDADSAADYARYIEQEVGFPVEGTLDDLLRFCGLDQVTGQQLETRSSRDLMASYPDRLLASRSSPPRSATCPGSAVLPPRRISGGENWCG